MLGVDAGAFLCLLQNTKQVWFTETKQRLVNGSWWTVSLLHMCVHYQDKIVHFVSFGDSFT